MESILSERVVYQSSEGLYHFDTAFRNAKDLVTKLATLSIDSETENALLNLYEATFKHKSFTGRSGSFFAYEGLGSTYWHMVSKLLLAAQENWLNAKTQNSPVAEHLAGVYYDIRAGIGFNKEPSTYGAFPTDPYSHTPETGIARQPGMTGQVKEELLTRFTELGLRWKNGTLEVVPGLIRASEFNRIDKTFTYLTTNNEWQSINVTAGSLAFTLAQTPVVISRAEPNESIKIQVTDRDNHVVDVIGTRIDRNIVSELINRSGSITRIDITLPVTLA